MRSYTHLHSNIRHGIFSSPDRDYISVHGEIRAYLDGVCKMVQSNNPGSTISPITNLVWRVAKCQRVLLEIKVSGDPPVYSYRYMDGLGQVHKGVTDKRSDLRSLILVVGK